MCPICFANSLVVGGSLAASAGLASLAIKPITRLRSASTSNASSSSSENTHA
jgi:hypothetical protein